MHCTTPSVVVPSSAIPTSGMQRTRKIAAAEYLVFIPAVQGVVKTSSNAQLATINLESRLSSHLKQYEADRCSEKEMFASTRSIMEASEADSALAYESLARDIANLHEDIQVFSSVQKSMAQTSTQVR